MDLIEAIIFLTACVVTLSDYASSLHLNDRVKRVIDAQSDYFNTIKYDARVTVLSEPLAFACTGSIIDDMFILTAAHCVVKPNSSEIVTDIIEVKAGITNLNDRNHVIRYVEKVYVPFMYYHDSLYPSTSQGDIAVLKLGCNLGLGRNPELKKLELPTEETNEFNINANDAGVFAGFGLSRKKYIGTSLGKNVYDETSPSLLQYASASVLPTQKCPVQNHYYWMCAKIIKYKYFDRNGGICHGDSGGALTAPTYSSSSVAIGIASHGAGGNIDCTEDSQHPSVYTRVSSFLDFIRKAKADETTYHDAYNRQYIRSYFYGKVQYCPLL